MEELGDSNVIRALVHELSDGNVIGREELCDGGVQVLVHSLVQELSDCNVIGAARSVQELGDCDIVGPLVRELGHTNVPILLLLLQELSHHRL